MSETRILCPRTMTNLKINYNILTEDGALERSAIWYIPADNYLLNDSFRIFLIKTQSF